MFNRFNGLLVCVCLMVCYAVNGYAQNRVELGTSYFNQSTIGRPISNAQIYVGRVDTDPEIVSNQKQVSIQQEDGTLIKVSQPLRTSAGGVILYDGSPVSAIVDGDYSIKVLSSSGAQLYYFPNLAVRYLTASDLSGSTGVGLDFYYPDSGETDQGVAGDGATMEQYIFDVSGTTKSTMYFKMDRYAGVTNEYVLSTGVTVSDNWSAIFENGAVIKVDSGAVLRFDSPSQINASPNQQIFELSGGTVSFTKSGFVHAAWFDDNIGKGTYDVTESYQEAIDSLDNGGTVIVSGGTSYIDTTTGILLDDGVNLVGSNKSSVLKALDDDSNDSGRIVAIRSGTAIPQHTTGLMSDIIIEGFTIDGNRDNHAVETNSTGGSTAASTTVTTSTSFFESGDVGKRLRVPNNKQEIAITDISASGANTVIECIRNDLKVGETLIVDDVTGSGDISSMNGNEYTIVDVTRNFIDQGQSVTVDYTINSGTYTSGGTVYGGSFAVLISTFTSATEVEVNVPMIVTATSLDLQIDSGEGNHGILIEGGGDVTVRDMIIKNCWGDGIDVTATLNFESGWQPPSENIVIENVISTNNLRQGLSAEGVDGLYISQSSFTYTNGTGPAAGIDIEPDGSRIVRNVSINDCIISNNDGPGLTMSKIFTDTSGDPLVIGNADVTGSWSIKAIDNKINSNGNHGVSIIGANEDILLDGNTMWWNKRAGLRVRGNKDGAHMGPVRIVDNDIQYNYAILGVSSGVTDATAGHGILMANGDTSIRMYGINIRGNTVAWNDANGILVGGFNSNYNHIADNQIFSNSQLEDDLYSNIYDYGITGEGLLIHDNIILEKFSNNNDRFGYAMTAFPRYAIFSEGGAADTTLIYNNYITPTGGVSVQQLHNETGAGRSFAWGNSNFKTESNVATISLNAATTGLQSVSVNHGLAITPKVRDVYLTLISDIDGTPISSWPGFSLPPIVELVDDTNITIRYNIDSAGVGNFKINCRIVSGRKI